MGIFEIIINNPNFDRYTIGGSFILLGIMIWKLSNLKKQKEDGDI